jgi:hypothetical protein
MRLSWFWAAVVLPFACPAEGPAQRYHIKLKSNVDAGMTVTIRHTEKDSGSMKLLDPKGKLHKKEIADGWESVYALTILQRKKSDGPAEKYKRVYEKATEMEEGKTRTLSYQGRTVVFERQGGVCRVGVAGKPPLKEQDLDRLIRRANANLSRAIDEDRAMTPTRAVAVGDRWTIEPKAIQSLSKGGELDLKASRAEARLVKVYKKGKGLFGVIEIDVKLVLKGIPPEIKFDPPCVMEGKMTIDTAIDGSSTARTEITTGKMKGKGVLQEGSIKLALELDGETSSRSVRSEEKDDAEARKVPAVRLVGPGGDWIEFTSKEGRFSATFPGKPKVTKEAGEGIATTTCEVSRDRGTIGYLIVFKDFTPANPNADPKTVLDAIAKKQAKNTRKKRDIKLNGFDGIELVLDLDDRGLKMSMTNRIFFVKGRLYQVLVVQTANAKEKPQVEKFLDSFKLHDKQEAKAPDKDAKK